MSMVMTPAVTGGVDTRADTHVAAALGGIGGLLGCRSSRRRRPGTRGYGAGCRVSARCAWPIEGAGSYGAGLARHICAAGVRVVGVGRSGRQDRRRRGKSDPLLRREVARSEWLCRLEVRRMSKT